MSQKFTKTFTLDLTFSSERHAEECQWGIGIDLRAATELMQKRADELADGWHGHRHNKDGLADAYVYNITAAKRANDWGLKCLSDRVGAGQCGYYVQWPGKATSGPFETLKLAKAAAEEGLRSAP